MKGKTGITSALSLWIVLLSASLSSFGQETINNLSVKLYTNFSYTNYESITYLDTGEPGTINKDGKDLQMGYFSPAFILIKPNGNYHEFELSRFRINRRENDIIQLVDSTGTPIQTISGETINEVRIAFRYEYNFRLFRKNENAKLCPYVGLSVNPYFSMTSNKPWVSLSYPSSETRFGAVLAIVPRLQYNINKSWYLDLNVLVSIADIYIRSSRIDNPTVPGPDRTTAAMVLEEFPFNVHVRLGAGFRF